MSLHEAVEHLGYSPVLPAGHSDHVSHMNEQWIAIRKLTGGAGKFTEAELKLATLGLAAEQALIGGSGRHG